MPKYYTPAIRFSSKSTPAFKKLSMGVEVVVQCTSDKSLRESFYSGVIRYRLDDWKRYTIVWLYGDSAYSDRQAFVQPAISDVSCSTYWENSRVTNPITPDVVTLFGSNFVPGIRVLVDDVEALSETFVDEHTMTFQPPPWGTEEAVSLTVVRPDLNESTANDLLVYDIRPILSGVSPTTVHNISRDRLVLTGNYFKPFSEILFASGSWTGSSNNITWGSPYTVSTYVPDFPSTGTFSVWVRSPSGLLSNAVSNLNVVYHPPVISRILPYNTGSINGSTPLNVSGNFFLSGAFVEFDGLPVLASSRSYYSNGLIDPTTISVLSPPHAKGAVTVVVTNPEDGQTSNAFPYQYIIPVPTITDVNFSGAIGASLQSRKTGSNGSLLYVTGTAFTGSDVDMVITSITLTSGVFLTSSTNFTIIDQTLLSYVIPALATGSKYDVTVSSSAGSATLSNAFEYADLPIIDSIIPLSGVVAGGTTLIITGRPFYGTPTADGPTRAKLNGVEANPTRVYAINQLTAVTPATGADGGYATVSIQNYGVLEGFTPNAFEYVPYPTASSVRTAAGNNKVPANTPATVTVIGTRLMQNIVNAGVEIAQGTRISIDAGTPVITSFVDNTQVQVSIPSHAVGFASIQPINRGLAVGATLTQAIEFVAVPSITTMTPNACAVSGGTTITIVGTNFINTTDTHVFIGTTEITPTTVSPTSLQFVTPARSAGTYSVTVVNKQTSVSNAVILSYLSAPFISGPPSPNIVSNAGGTVMTVNGGNFASGMTAWLTTGSVFASTTSVAVNYINQNQFSFVSPAATIPLGRGAVNLYVNVLGQQGHIDGVTAFEQPVSISSISPGTSLIAGGSTITINGDGFIAGVTIVSIDGVGVAATVVNRNRLTFVAPPHAAATVTVTVANTIFSANTTFTYTIGSLPIISQVIVNGYDAAGNLRMYGPNVHYMTINGSNFTSTGSPLINIVTDGMLISPSTATDTQLTFIWPVKSVTQQATGYFAIRTPAGDSNYFPYTLVPLPVMSNFFPDGLGIPGGTVTSNGAGYTPSTVFSFYTLYPSVKYTATTTYISPTQMSVTVPTISPLGFGKSSLYVTVENPTTVPGETLTVNAGIYKLYAPPMCTVLSPASGLTAGGYTVYAYHNALYSTDALLSVAGSAVASTPGVNYNTYTAPAHAAGAVGVGYYYTNNVGTVFSGGTQTFTYNDVLPLVATMVGSTSSREIQVIPGSMNQVNIVTTPALAVTVAGGAGPFTCTLEQYPDPVSDYGAPLTMLYGTLAGYERTAKWSETGYFTDGDTAQLRYRWKVVDSLGTTAYSVDTAILYYAVWSAELDPRCVVPETPVLMINGTIKLAGDIQVGDYVLTYPESMDTTSLGEYRVTNVTQDLNRTVTVILTDGRSLKCSYNHRLATKDGWMEADHLLKGDVILGSQPGTVAEVVQNGIERVVQLTVAGARTFISNGLLSHNLKIGPGNGGPPRLPP